MFSLRSLASFLYPLFLLFPRIQGIPLLQNITIPLPAGSSDHGTPGILCTPTKWTDIVIFYLANYAAHAATTRSLPGEETSRVGIIVFTALLFPAAGAFRGILGIASFSIFGKTDLEKAARARALCMVVRNPEWQPQDGDILDNTILCQSSQPAQSESISLLLYKPSWRDEDSSSEDDLSKTRFKIHGHYNLPPGFSIDHVSRQATFIEPSGGLDSPKPNIAFNYSLVKILISLGQAIYAIFTLYQTRGDQITQFGYAAFGLTVAPYAVVSLLNLFGSLFCPEFTALYMVESSIMDEARRRGKEYFFNGTVGRIDEENIQKSPEKESIKSADSTNNEQLYQWVLEPVTVTVDALVGLQVKSQTQVGLSNAVVVKAPNSKPAAEERLSGDVRKEVPAIPEILVEEAAEKKIAQTDSNKMSTAEISGERKTNVSPKTSDSLSEKFLYIPLMNPIKLKGSSRQTDSYKLTSTNNTNLRCPLTVGLAHEVTSDTLSDTIVAFSIIFALIVTLIPVTIIGAMTGFHAGHSTRTQRIWTMTWLSFGALGPILNFWLKGAYSPTVGAKSVNVNVDKWVSPALSICMVLLWAVPAIGGFVVVGQMLESYGTCIGVS